MIDGIDMTDREERLIARLVGEMTAVRLVASPAGRTLAWLAAVAGIACAISVQADLAGVWARLTGAADMWLSFLATCLTAVLAALAAFQLSLPDRRLSWALLPLPALAVWIGASGIGCLRTWLIPGVEVIPLDHIKQCFIFIVGLSIPLSALLIAMLRKGYSLHPTIDAALAGLAVAAAAAALLTLVHPFEATVIDLGVHFVSVGFIVTANRIFGGAILRRSGTAANSV